MKNDIKLIALDMDGTVLNSKKQITAYTEQILRKAAAAGILIVPATGRPLSTVPLQLSADYARYAVTSAGAVVIDRQIKKNLYTNGMTPQAVQRIVQYCRQNGFYHEWFINGKPCTDTLEILKKYGKEGMRSSYTQAKKISLEVTDILTYAQEKTYEVEKMNAFLPHVPDYQRHWDWFAKDVDIVLTESDPDWIEINNAGVNKAEGIKQLCQVLHIAPQQVMAMGDNDNDKEMLEFAGVAVAMKNGLDKIKDMAAFVTKSNDEDGVAFAIEQLIFEV